MDEDTKNIGQVDIDALVAKVKAANEANLEKIGVVVEERVKKELDERLEDFKADLKSANKRPPLDPREDPKGGFKDFGHFCNEIYCAGEGGRNESELLKTYRKNSKAAGSPSQTAGDAETGGYVIPTEFSNILLERMIQENAIMQRAMVIPMATNKISIPYIDGFNEANGTTSGNVVCYWKGEEKQYTAKNIKFGEVDLNLSKLTGLAYLSEEMMQFSPMSVETILNNAFSSGMMRAMNRAFIRGTGVGQPVGILNANCKIEVAKETGQAADTVEIENLTKMYARLYSESENGGGGVWMANKTVIPQLLTMSLSVGTGGSAVYINNAVDAPTWGIFGDPVMFSDQMSALGDAGDICCVDWSKYLIGQSRGGIMGTQSIHLKFDYGQTAFRWTTYVDGQPWWPEAFSPEYGDTQSPIVTLAERA